MQVMVDLPDELALLLDETSGRAGRGLLLEAATSLVARGCLSSGKRRACWA